jgi:hypothetical protein
MFVFKRKNTNFASVKPFGWVSQPMEIHIFNVRYCNNTIYFFNKQENSLN